MGVMGEEEGSVCVGVGTSRKVGTSCFENVQVCLLTIHPIEKCTHQFLSQCSQ